MKTYLPDGCLMAIGGPAGMHWEIVGGEKSDGWPQLRSQSRPSHSDKGMEILMTRYRFDPAKKRYVEVSSKLDVSPEPD